MSTTLQPFFSAQAQLLADGRIGSLARHYATPLPVLLPKSDAWMVLPARAAVIETFWSKHRSVRAAGVGRLRACVTREAAGGGDRRMAEVTWFYVGAGGRRLGRTVARYYVARRAEGLRVELLEFRRVAFPQLHGWFAANAARLPPGRRFPT